MRTIWRAESETSYLWYSITQQYICTCCEGHRPTGKSVSTLWMFCLHLSISLLNAKLRVERVEHNPPSLCRDFNITMHLPNYVFSVVLICSLFVFFRLGKETDKSNTGFLCPAPKPSGLMKMERSCSQSHTLAKLQNKDIRHYHSGGESQISAAPQEETVRRASQSAPL